MNSSIASERIRSGLAWTVITGLVCILLVTASSGLATAISTPSHSESSYTQTTPVVDSEQETVDVVITFESFQARQKLIAQGNITVTGGQDIQFMPVLFANVSPSALPRLQSAPGVTSVHQDSTIHLPPKTPNSTDSPGISAATQYTPTPWGVHRINAPAATSHLPESALENVTIAIVDSGIDYDHPSLNESVVWGGDFTHSGEQYGRQAADDNAGHGTNVAGIIAAGTDGNGVTGVAPNTSLYAIKVLSADGSGTISSLIQGIDAAVRGPDGTVGTADDADIIQLSLGTSLYSSELNHVVSAASNHSLIVTSAGNSGDGDPTTSTVTYPAKFEDTIAVAATNTQNQTLPYSAEGPAITVAAPGDSVTTLQAGGGTTQFSGTSAAAPHVAGALAVLEATDQEVTGGERTTTELQNALVNTTHDIKPWGFDHYSGHGLIDVEAAAESLQLNAQRTVSQSTVESGQSVSITVEAHVTAPSVTISESINPAITASNITATTVNNESTASTLSTSSDTNAVVVLDGLTVDDTVTVTYSIQIPENAAPGETYTISGQVTTKNTTDTLPTTDLTVTEESNTTITEIYDSNKDGEISLVELAEAASDYAQGDLSLTELGIIATEYSNTA